MITVAVVRDRSRSLIGRLQAEPKGYEVCIRFEFDPKDVKWRRVLTPLLEAHIMLGLTQDLVVQTHVDGKPVHLLLTNLVEMLSGNELVVEYMPVSLKEAHRLELNLSLEKPRLPSDWVPISDTLKQMGVKGFAD